MFLQAKIAAVEFVGDEVRVAVVASGGNAPAVLELHSCRAVYSDPEQRFEALVHAIETVQDGLKHNPSSWVLCLGSEYAVVRAMTLPFKGHSRVASAVQFELEPYLAFPIEELLVDYQLTGEFGKETDVLAIGMRRNHVEESMALLEAAGIDTEAVTMDAVALTGLWRARQGKLKGLKAVLHLREKHAALAITWNNALASFRHLSLTAEDLRENPAQSAREIQNTLRAFRAQWRGEEAFEELFLTGTTLSDETRTALEEFMELPIQEECMVTALKGGLSALDALRSYDAVLPEEGVEALEDDMPSGASAALPVEDSLALRDGSRNTWDAMIGAAMSAAGGGYPMDFNRDERAWQSGMGSLLSHLTVTACILLAVLLGWSVYYHQAALRNEKATQTIQQDIDTIMADLEQMASQGIGEDIEMQPYEDPALLDLLSEFSAKMPEDKVEVTEIKIKKPGDKGYWIQIRGIVKDMNAFGNIQESLKSSKFFRVKEDAELKLQQEETTFTLEVYRREEAINENES